MRRLILIPLLLTSCKDNDNSGGSCNNDHKNSFRSGALCSSAGTCPPNQICTTENVCRKTCTNPMLSGMGTGPTSNCECSGPQPSGTTNGDQCDLDHYCRLGCSGGPPSPGQCS